MTLDYVGEKAVGKPHGFVFKRERVTEVGSEMMRVTGANMDEEGGVVAFVTEVCCYVFYGRFLRFLCIELFSLRRICSFLFFCLENSPEMF